MKRYSYSMQTFVANYSGSLYKHVKQEVTTVWGDLIIEFAAIFLVS